MKKRMIIILLCGIQAAFAEQLVTRDGITYEDVTIVSVDPERMLIVHNGGGCQVEYTALVPGSLTARQLKAIEMGLKDYVTRTARREEVRLEKETFALAQREKGLILFEENWMKPAERQEMMALRELQKLERERLHIELEKQKVELRQAQLLAEQEQLRRDESRKSRRSSFSYYYSTPVRRSRCGCSHPGWCRHSSSQYKSGNWSSSHWNSSGLNIHYSRRENQERCKTP